MRVRRATLREWEQLRALHGASLEPSDQFTLTALRRKLRMGRVWLARLGGVAVGLCMLERNGYISAIAVLPELRRRGVGAALLRAAIRAGARRCEIRARNIASEALFKQAGFAVTGLKAGRYADGEAALEMERV